MDRVQGPVQAGSIRKESGRIDRAGSSVTVAMEKVGQNLQMDGVDGAQRLGPDSLKRWVIRWRFVHRWSLRCRALTVARPTPSLP